MSYKNSGEVVRSMCTVLCVESIAMTFNCSHDEAIACLESKLLSADDGARVRRLLGIKATVAQKGDLNVS